MKTFITDLNLIWGWTDPFNKVLLFMAIFLYVNALILIIGGILSCLHPRFKGCIADMLPTAAVVFVIGTFLFYVTKTDAMQSYQMFQSITSGEYTVYVNGKLTDEAKYARLVAMQSMTVDYIIDEDAKEILITERNIDRRTLQERKIDTYWEKFKEQN